ncbi:hypothetical protein PPACK8108_LOCUS16858 [Phakopsora pachyrhizi]|uniref:Uncharacterized protein n=1 Tax=Phakopsora pachyrhizi TaxID=170000 RepID=A0AAV0B9Z4_PHAPC|nr:hypothetical protein PPACK8108_LOCUS16858 [Phakopsora pachyrhizi]
MPKVSHRKKELTTKKLSHPLEDSDFVTAYLNATLEEDETIYMNIPEGFKKWLVETKLETLRKKIIEYLLRGGLSRNSQGTVDEVKKQIELGLLGSSKGRIQLVVLMNLHLKFRNKERTKEIQNLSQSLDMTNDDSRENRREPTRQ